MWYANPPLSYRIKASPTKGNTPNINPTFAPTGIYTERNSVGVQTISAPLAAQVISGTFAAVMQIMDLYGTGDSSLQVALRVVSGDGLTQRGVLYAGHNMAMNATIGALGEGVVYATYQTRIIPAGTALTQVTALEGDRLIIELGVKGGTGGFGQFRIGFRDLIADADYALTSGVTTILTPWLELSQTLNFYVPPPPPPGPGWGMLAR